jgi:hypothetical protein
MSSTSTRLLAIGALVASASAAFATSSSASAERPADPGVDRAAEVAAHWTPERIASAQPRDLVIDQRGLGYLRGSDGSLSPYGHSVRARLVATSTAAAGTPTPAARPPGGGGDTTPPEITGFDPATSATIGGSHTFSATVTDASGIKSVSFLVGPVGQQPQSFTPSMSGDVYRVDLTGFSDGNWTWQVVAKDGGPKGGNTATSPLQTFTVSTGVVPPPDPPGDGEVVTNSRWTGPGDIRTAAGRILFEMPTNRRATRWAAYVCSGTTVVDQNTNASVILTAAHCVYDDVSGNFARNVLFIPDQDGTTGSGTDSDCGNDPLGCWAPSHGVVDADWTLDTFPDNIPYDYAYYVVPDGAHSGAGAHASLESAVNELTIDFDAPSVGGFTHALGYSYSDDPNFMYCAEGLSTEPSYDDWWLESCGLSGGSSGGPWIQPMTDGSGPIISVNSWGYTGQPGMAGPPLTTSAGCVFAAANDEAATVVDRGIVVNCP